MFSYDARQQLYRDAIDSMNHLCNNIEPGTDTVILVLLDAIVASFTIRQVNRPVR